MIAIEQTTDENTGLECWLVVDTVTTITLDRAFDREYALEIAEYYNDIMTEDVDTE